MDGKVKTMIGVVFFVVIALCLVPTVITFSTNAANNFTAAGDSNGATIAQLVPFFYVLAVLGGAAGAIYKTMSM